MSPFLSIKNISKHYTSSTGVKEALKGVSFEVNEGEIFALLGVNGAGKTTLSSIIASVHPPSGGDLEWKGLSIYKDLFNYRKQVGLCPQKPNLDTRLSLSENLYFAGRVFGLSHSDSVARKDELIERFEMGQMAQREIFALSGGYRQRFLIARTLMHRPKLILLDEPTVGLDPHIRKQLWEIVLDLKKEGCSVILTTHYLEEAEGISDRVCIIDGGEVKLIDTPAQLKQSFQKHSLEDVFIQLLQEIPKEDNL